MNSKTKEALEFARQLLIFANEFAATVPDLTITKETCTNPKTAALALLCRSITNFKGAIILDENDQPVESRALVRLIVENFFHVAALCDQGADFVKKMRSDEAFNRKSLGQFAIGNMTDDAKDGEKATIIKTQIRSLIKDFPNPKKLSVVGVAKGTSVYSSYLSYAILSMDAHPSITTLKRQIKNYRIGNQSFAKLNPAPKFTEKERIDTIDEAYSALLGVCVGVNQIIGITSINKTILQLVGQLEARRKPA